MRWLLAVGVVIAATGCGGTSQSTDPIAPTGTSTSTAPASDGGTDAAPSAPGDAPLTEAECGRMSDHMVYVRVDEMRSADPDSVPTPEQQKAIRENLRLEFVKTCMKEGVSREVFKCWVRSTTTGDLAACAGSSGDKPTPTDVGNRSP